MNNLRKALEEAIVFFRKSAEIGRDIDPDEWADLFESALQSADTWREPDETTPDDAAGYGRKTINDSETGKPFIHWQCASIKMLRLTGYTDIVLAKENQGPPPVVPLANRKII